MPFPEPQDEQLQKQAQELERLIAQFDNWIVRVKPHRQEEHKLPPNLPARVLKIKREAEHLRVATSVPPATALYGASQSGKSLLIGRLLGNPEGIRRTLGVAENDGVPESLDFTKDLNPQLRVEATAVVTRFSLAERAGIDPSLTSAPVRARLFSRSDIMKALGRGFGFECRGEKNRGDEIRKRMKSRVRKGGTPDLEWRADILEAYEYLADVLGQERLAYGAEALDRLLETPLTSDGYLELACLLFWEGWDPISDLFKRLVHARNQTFGGARFIHLPWQAVHFILNAQRATEYPHPSSTFGKLSWHDVRLLKSKDPVILSYGGKNGTPLDLEAVQGVIAELQLPVLAKRLNPLALKLFENGDCLDIPGAVAAGTGRGAWTQDDVVKERSSPADEAERRELPLRLLKRGKVGLLFDKYAQEFQANALIYLQRDGVLEAHAELRPQLQQWVTRSQQKAMDLARLFVCLTHLKRVMSVRADAQVFESWIGQQIAANFSSWFNNSGAPGTPFQNLHLLRYPDTLDREEGQPDESRIERWREEFLKSEAVNTYVDRKEDKWKKAFGPDGGLEALIEAVVQRLDNTDRRQMLSNRLYKEARNLRDLLRDLYVDPNRDQMAQERRAIAKQVINWLNADQAGRRTRALIDMLHCDANLVESAVRGVQGPNPVGVVPLDYEQVVRTALDGWLAARTQQWKSLDPTREETFAKFGSFLVQYLQSNHAGDGCLKEMGRAFGAVHQAFGTDAALTAFFRRYAELIFDDYLLRPGPEEPAPAQGTHRLPSLIAAQGQPHQSMVERWERILAERLASPVSGGQAGTLAGAGNTDLGEHITEVSALLASLEEKA